MSKMTPEQKEVRKALKFDLMEMEGELFNFEVDGIVILVCPAVAGDAEFAHVAVAQCCEDDVFKRKQGELLALSRWQDGEVMRVRYNDRENADIADQLIEFLAP